MSMTPAEANRALSRLRDMPYGLVRTQSAERLLETIEESGPEESLAYALYVLVESYYWGGESPKAYLPFQRQVRLWESRPELFDTYDRHSLFWSFKWMVGGLDDYPNVPAEQITATLADMERRYALEGLGRSAVVYSRWAFANHRGLAEAEELLHEWLRTPTDDFSQCEACSISDELEFYAARGECDRVIRRYAELDHSELTCATEPANLEAVLALVHLEVGDAAAAVAAHRRAVAALATSDSDMGAAWGRTIELLARGGANDRAVDTLTAKRALLTTGDTPLTRLRFLIHLTSALAVLVATEPERPVELGVAAGTLGELSRWVEKEAAALAAAFDTRNGTRRFAGLLERARQAEPGVHLDFDVLGGLSPEPAGGDGDGDGDRVPGAPGSGSAPVASDWAELEEAAHRAERTGDLQAAATGYLAAADAAAAVGALSDSGYAQANAARCAAELSDDAGAHAAFGVALEKLKAGGEEPEKLVEVLVAWAPLATTTVRANEVLAVARDVLGRIAAIDLAGLSEDLRTTRERELSWARAELDDATARIVATVPGADGWTLRDAVSLATSAAETYADLGQVDSAAHAFWLAGRVNRELGEVDGAIFAFESAFEGFGIAHQQRERAQVADELINALRSAGQEDRADAVVGEIAGLE